MDMYCKLQLYEAYCSSWTAVEEQHTCIYGMMPSWNFSGHHMVSPHVCPARMLETPLEMLLAVCMFPTVN